MAEVAREEVRLMNADVTVGAIEMPGEGQQVDLKIIFPDKSVGVLLSPDEARELAANLYDAATEVEMLAYEPEEELSAAKEIFKKVHEITTGHQPSKRADVPAPPNVGRCAHSISLLEPCGDCHVETEQARSAL
jgi:hypothetical protein